MCSTYYVTNLELKLYGPSKLELLEMKYFINVGESVVRF